MIYLDNAATTKMAPGVLEVMMPYFQEQYANPGGVYGFSTACKKEINKARDVIAESIGAERSEIYFTSGGSEADNWALLGVAEACADKGRHIITTAIEHHAVLHTCKYLEKHGFEVTYLEVDKEGILDMERLRKAIRKDTILISVMFANNEIGSLQPIEEIGQIAKEHGILFHTDAVQAYGHLPVDVKKYYIDLLSASAHKLNGPKGIGFLYIGKNVKLSSFIHGGAQERGRRAGTENVPAIVGFGKAAELAVACMEQRAVREKELSGYLIERIEAEIPYCRLNGHRTKRLPNNVNFSFDFVESESALILLDQSGICASGGSACTSGATDPSHVLLALGVAREQARGAIRMTLSAENTEEELDIVVDKLKEIVSRLRNMSSLYAGFMANKEA